jgi:hypothetical protein
MSAKNMIPKRQARSTLELGEGWMKRGLGDGGSVSAARGSAVSDSWICATLFTVCGGLGLCEDVVKAVTEFLDGVRFQQQVWKAETADTFVVLGTDISGGNQDGHARPGLQKPARKIDAGHLRHRKIAHDYIKIMRP